MPGHRDYNITQVRGLRQYGPEFGDTWYVDSLNGSDSNTRRGRQPTRAFRTMSKAFEYVRTGDRIYLMGPIFENLVAPAGVCDVHIIGLDRKPRHGSLTNTSEMGAASWRTAAGVTDEPLLQLHCQGWRFTGILFAPPSAEAAVEVQSDGAATPEKTGGHAIFERCRFAGGKWGITDNGGSGFLGIYDCRFEGLTTAAIQCLNTANAIPLQWEVMRNWFGYGSASHILASASHWRITDNEFGLVAATARYVDLIYNSGQGLQNIVTRNLLRGLYDTSDYQGSATDDWTGNFSADVDEDEVADNGLTIAPPAAP